MNILFLDIDGVLSTLKMLFAYNEFKFDPVGCRCLFNFVKTYNYRIVLSSDWRIGMYDDYKNQMKEVCPDLLEYDTGLSTPYFFNRSREEEIISWINENSDFYKIKNFLILDDMPLKFNNLKYQSRFVKILNGWDGFGAVEYEKMREIVEKDNV